MEKNTNFWGETERLFLRKITYDDSTEIAEIMRGSNVQKIWGYYFSDRDVHQWIEKCINCYEQYNNGFFLAIEKVSNNVVGQIALKPDIINEIQRYEIGYILKEKYEHNGYATEGAAFMADYALNKIHLSEVIFEIRPINQKSINVAKRLGAVQDGSFIKKVKDKDMEHLIFVLREYNKKS